MWQRQLIAVLILLGTSAHAQFLPGNVLIMDDADSVGMPLPPVGSAEQACINLGIPHTVTHDFASFDAELAMGGYDLVITSHINIAGQPTNGQLNRINSYLHGGGRVIFGSWALAARGLTNHPLFATMGVDVTATDVDLTVLTDAWAWVPSDPMVAALPNPSRLDGASVAFTVDAMPANAIPGSSVALMGFTASESVDQGLIIARNDRQAIYLGHFPQLMDPFLITGATLIQDVMGCMFDPACRNPTCLINAPTAGSALGGEVTLDLDGMIPTMVPVDLNFGFSIDGGATWSPCSTAPSSPVSNPASGVPAPFAALGFIWDSFADGVGFTGTQPVELRIIIDTGVIASDCSVSVLVDNRPSCAITAPVPGSMLAGEIPIDFSAADPAASALDTSFEFSLDGGVTWSSATAAPTSPLSNPDLGRPAPFSAQFIWDSLGDGVGLVGSQGVEFRIATFNPGGGTSSCQVSMLLVSNAPSCAVSSPTPGSTVWGEVSMLVDGDDPAGDPVTSTFEFSLDGGTTWTLAAAAASSPSANPDVARPTPYAGLNFVWDSLADAVGLVTPQAASLRVTIDDGIASSTCGLVVFCDNAPTLTITSPAPGSTVAADVTLTFDATDPSLLPLTSTFEFSLDGGATYTPATAAATSPLPNPDPGRPSPIMAASFIWDSFADGIGLLAPVGTVFRITVYDGFATASKLLVLVVDNVAAAPSCTMNAPAGLQTQDIAFTLDVQSPSSAIVTTVLEWSIDGGSSYQPCTMSLASPTGNPAAGVPTALAASFIWDSFADGIGLAALAPGVILRATVADGISPLQGRCSTTLDIDNTTLCNGVCGDCNLSGTGPDTLDALLAAQIAVQLVSPSASQSACCDVNSSAAIDILDALLISRLSAGLPELLSCP